MIKEPLSSAAAEQIFMQEAICFGNRDAIPLYRMVELFGESAGYYIERNMGFEKYLVGGRDYNSRGSGSEEAPIIDYFYKEGFMKVVTNHNYLYSVAAKAAREAAEERSIMQKPKDNIVEKIYLEMFSDAESEREAAARERLKAIMKEHGVDEEIISESIYAFSVECGCNGFAQGLGFALEMHLDVSKVGEIC